MPTALIAEDEPMLRAQLRTRLADAWPELAVVAEAENGEQALALFDAHHPDIVFLDIRMPGLTGIELARRIDTRTHIVFVTAFDQYAVEAFDREVIDYLLKPVTDERLARCVERLKRKIGDAEKPPGLQEMLAKLARAMPAAPGKLRWVRASKGELVQQIAVDDVLYFQASDKYTCVMTREGESLIRLPLAELATQLDAQTFWQIHRGTVVNMNEVSATRRDLGGRVFVKLKDGKTELPVSRAYAHLFKQM